MSKLTKEQMISHQITSEGKLVFDTEEPTYSFTEIEYEGKGYLAETRVQLPVVYRVTAKLDTNRPPKDSDPEPIEGPFFTRHNQIAYITWIDDRNPVCLYGHGYIIGDDGKKHKCYWYKCDSNSDMPYVKEADYPSGRDLFVKPVEDPLYWASDKNSNTNGKHRL